MWTSVPQTPARRTRMRTSSSRILGSATSFSLKPGAADSLTSAFTSHYSEERREIFLVGVQTASCEPLLEVTRGCSRSNVYSLYAPQESVASRVVRTSLATERRDSGST